MFSKLFKFINNYPIIILVVILLIGSSVFYSNKSGITTNTSSQKINTKTIDTSLPDLQNQFEKMKNDAKWDVTRPLYWGYYFYDKDKEKLQKFSMKLRKEGLQTYKIEKSAAFTSGQYLLYAFEYTVKTPESLFERCNELSKLAIDNKIEEFDGWEAGPEPL